MSYLLLVTPHHTATWFWINFITKHPEVKGFSAGPRLRRALRGEYIRKKNKYAKHIKDEFFITGAKNLIHMHLDSSSNFVEKQFMTDNDAFLMLMLMTPTVISIRDPLAAMISRTHRRPDLSESEDMLAEWDTLVWHMETIGSLEDKKAQPLVIATDLLNDKEKKFDAGKKVLQTYGLESCNETDAFLKEWSKSINSRGNYNLKIAYKAGDKLTLERGMGSLWGNLKKREDTLRPFLEKQGYSNLLWWS